MSIGMMPSNAKIPRVAIGALRVWGEQETHGKTAPPPRADDLVFKLFGWRLDLTAIQKPLRNMTHRPMEPRHTARMCSGVVGVEHTTSFF